MRLLFCDNDNDSTSSSFLVFPLGLMTIIGRVGAPKGQVASGWTAHASVTQNVEGETAKIRHETTKVLLTPIEESHCAAHEGIPLLSHWAVQTFPNAEHIFT